MSFAQALPWHSGEDRMHQITRVPVGDNPSSPFLTPQAASMIQRYPLMALGTLDSQSRPWCTLWGGEAPISQPVGKSVIGIRGLVDGSFDPVVAEIFQGKDDGEVVKSEGEEGGRMVSALSIDLETRGRMKLFGRMIAGALSAEPQPEAESQHQAADRAEKQEVTKVGKPAQVQLVLHILQSLGNCPKYLNARHIIPIPTATFKPRIVPSSTSNKISPRGLKLLEKADLFFIASAHAHEDMDLNHRGGPPGFVRVEPNSNILVWPEYSGNNLYQTLGNLTTTPQAGMCIPDFETGDVLYLTGTTEVLVGKEAKEVMPKCAMCVRVRVEEARFVEKGLPVRGVDIEGQGRSPYNPRVWYLKSESQQTDGADGEGEEVMATIVSKTQLTPTIYRYAFTFPPSNRTTLPPPKPGQYALLSFKTELDMGYSHMRDDDPTSLNDDWLRTFTVSSRSEEGFEITVRNVGAVTSWMARQRIDRGIHLEVGVSGFAGDFFFKQTEGRKLGFMAGGIGVTPLLSQLPDLDLVRLRVVWSVAARDVGLVVDSFERYPRLAACTEVFFTGEVGGTEEKEREMLEKVKGESRRCEMRRVTRQDLEGNEEVDDWYLCAAPVLRKQVQAWLPGRQVIFENFDY